LTIAMDNCGGQNKNNAVLRLAPYLVEMGYFLTVEHVFYIRGHTKNACDRMLNQMKLKFHRSEIFSWGQAIETLNIKEHVTIVDAQKSHFKDYGALLDKFYVNFKPNTIQKNHIFKVESTDEALTMQCATHDGAVFANQPMLKKGQVLIGKRTDAINACELAILKPPGMRPIKQVELYKKFRPFVPREFWEETCPKPSEAVLTQVRNETAAKRKVKAAAAKAKKDVPAEAAAPQAKSVKAKAAPNAKAEATKRKAAGQRAARYPEQKKGHVMVGRGRMEKRAVAGSDIDSDSDYSE
jgi:hypothetical protein